MREHVERSRETLLAIPFLSEAAKIAYAHHERWDGNGYPRRLQGEQIPLGARVLAIADAFDAIISDQPHRAAQSLEIARAEIKRNSGTQFDPEIVKVFLRVPDNIWEDLRRENQRRCSRARYFQCAFTFKATAIYYERSGRSSSS